MADSDEFWGHLLAHLRQRVLVPVVGPDVTLVKTGGVERPLHSLIAEGLAARYDLTSPSGIMTTGDAVSAFLRERGRDEVEWLYPAINDIIDDLDPEPGTPLRDLAAIDDLHTFVSTTPDRMLATALNEVRFGGLPRTREVQFSLNQSTAQQSCNEAPAAPTDTVVLSLFGQAASTPTYAIHEEDRLEWLHALLSDSASLPSWLDNPLKSQPMLFIGCEIPDWVGRFLLRKSSSLRLSMERIPFFFVGSPDSGEPALSNFFKTYCRKTLVQQLEMEPAAFVSQLRTRWQERQNSAARRSPVGSGAATKSGPEASTIFISYMREDAVAAQKLYDAITRLGGDVWMDTRALVPGAAWEPEILTHIRETVRLFIPVVSANTERAEEGYVFREWDEAATRCRSIPPGRRFIVPVVIDGDYDGDAGRYRQTRPYFERQHFGHAPGGEPDAALLAALTADIRAMRRTDAA